MGPADRALRQLSAADIEVHDVNFWPKGRLATDRREVGVVTLLDVVECLPGHPLSLLRACADRMRSKGTLLLGGPNAVALARRAKILRGVHPYSPYDDWMRDAYYGHFREHTPSAYSDMLRLAGLRVLRTELVEEPSATRARSSYHGRRHGRLSLVATALTVMWYGELLLPGLRPSVYRVATRDAAAPGA